VKTPKSGKEKKKELSLCPEMKTSEESGKSVVKTGRKRQDTIGEVWLKPACSGSNKFSVEVFTLAPLRARPLISLSDVHCSIE